MQQKVKFFQLKNLFGRACEVEWLRGFVTPNQDYGQPEKIT